ncbi:hypothetical protein, partial [Polynucleobacter sp. AP-Kaivos-20-H2]|uniref:hypothetical protein n=1 Tax=Polynucleobacter sp. AP-Kaivos-20-H2 TaxID=2689104 RepID=UPI001C0CA51D
LAIALLLKAPARVEVRPASAALEIPLIAEVDNPAMPVVPSAVKAVEFKPATADEVKFALSEVPKVAKALVFKLAN